MNERDISKDELLYYLTYYSDTGLFIRRIASSQNTNAGDIAGNIDTFGYRVIGILGIQIRAHRIAYKIMTGEWPPLGYEVDHVNGIKDDNSWDNLRLATKSQNRLNLSTPAHNTSGIKGVSLHKKTNTWRVCVMLNGKQYSGGYFEDINDAEAAAINLRERLHQEFANHG